MCVTYDEGLDGTTRRTVISVVSGTSLKIDGIFGSRVRDCLAKRTDMSKLKWLESLERESSACCLVEWCLAWREMINI